MLRITVCTNSMLSLLSWPHEASLDIGGSALNDSRWGGCGDGTGRVTVCVCVRGRGSCHHSAIRGVSSF